MLVFSV